MTHVSKETELTNVKNSSNKLSTAIINIWIFLTDPDFKEIFSERFLDKLLHPDN